MSEAYKEHLCRSAALLGEGAIEGLRQATVLVAGLGGTGGALAVTLARMGVGRLIIADPGRFDTPDVNRQWAARRSVMSRNKAEVYAEILADIIPGALVRSGPCSGGVRVEHHPEGVTAQNVGQLVDQADLVCDNLDVTVEFSLRARMLELARERGIYSMSCPVIGFGAFFAAAAPDGHPMSAFLELLGRATREHRIPRGLADVFHPEHLSRMEQQMQLGVVPSVAVGPQISSAICATEAAMILLEGEIDPWRAPLVLPRVLVVDLFSMAYHVMEVDDL